MVLIPAANMLGVEFRKCSKSRTEVDWGRPCGLLPVPWAGAAALMPSLVGVCITFPEGKPVV